MSRPPNKETVRRAERLLLAALAQGTREGSFRELARSKLAGYHWREPVHEVIFRCLLSLPTENPAVVREQLPALLTRRGFPDVELADLFSPLDLPREVFERVVEELTS
jgi:hypothetical protein